MLFFNRFVNSFPISQLFYLS